MDYLLQLQNFAGSFLSHLSIGAPVTVNLPENVGDINLGSTFGDLGSTFGSGDFGSTDFGSDLTSNPGLGSSNFLNPNLGGIQLPGQGGGK